MAPIITARFMIANTIVVKMPGLLFAAILSDPQKGQIFLFVVLFNTTISTLRSLLQFSSVKYPQSFSN